MPPSTSTVILSRLLHWSRPRSTAFLITAIALCLARPAHALRIISLLPSNTEIIEALGAGDEIVGTTVFDRTQPGREPVGDFLHPNVEKIVALKPDLIIAGHWKNSRAAARLEAIGYRVIEIEHPHSLDEIYASILLIAGAIGRAEAGPAVVADMKKDLAALAQRAQARPRRRVFIEIDRGLWTVGGHDFMTEAFALLGLDSIFSDLRASAAQVSAEVILKRNPEVILSLAESAERVRARSGWQNVDAVQAGRVLDRLDVDALTHPSPRFIEGLQRLSKTLDALEKKS